MNDFNTDPDNPGPTTSFSGTKPEVANAPDLRVRTHSVGLFTIGGILIALGLVAIAYMRTGTGTPPVQQSRSPTTLPRCSRQDVFDQARQGGVSTLRAYLRECQPNGIFVQQTRNALETAAYNDTAACVARSCNPGACLATYTADFPAGPRLTALQTLTQHKLSSDECQPYCSQQAPLQRVVSGDLSGLRTYVRQCQPTGRFLMQAKNELEKRLYVMSTSCIARECSVNALNGCLGTYNGDFPNGPRSGELLNQARQALASPRCRPAPPPDQHWCPYPGAPVGWWCRNGQQCNAAGGCIAQGPSRPIGVPAPPARIGPIGVPMDIGTPAR